MVRVIEGDVCIIGSGITAAMVAEKLAGERNARIVVIEAGDEAPPLAHRAELRRRYLEYGENCWQRDHIPNHGANGIQSRSMQVGGLAMHWGGVTPRFSPEDFRVKSLFGVGDDWPLTYEDLDPFYQEAEERMGVAGEQGPPALDPRGKPFPMPPLPLSYNLRLLKEWAAKSEIALWSQPSAKNSIPYGGRSVCCRSDTCFPICPVGARYSPDHTWDALRKENKVELIPRTLVRRLVPDGSSNRISHASAVDRDRPDAAVELRASTFVLAGGYAWSPHLLLLSATSRFPKGIANRSGLVGRYMAGHRNVGAYVQLPLKLYPGINEQHSLVSKQFMRTEGSAETRSRGSYIRHDLRIWESSVGRQPRLLGDRKELLLGDALMDDWKRRTETGTARLRSYYDVLPARESALTLDESRRNEWGDPMPRLDFRDSDTSRLLRKETEERIVRLFERMAKAGGGEILSVRRDAFQDHPAGGCRMGDNPATSVTDSFGRSHDHENLYVIGAPTCVTAGCANGTLTFCALALRSAVAIGESFPTRLSPTTMLP